MENYSYTSFSTNASPATDVPLRTMISGEYLNNNPLRASQVVATSKLASRTIGLSIEGYQLNFVLLAAEVDRLLILNSLMSKEAEHWRKKFLEFEKVPSPQRVILAVS